MAVSYRISIFCPDRIGLVSVITGKLFDLGINLGDSTFAVLGSGAEITALCEAPDEVTPELLKSELQQLQGLEQADISIKSFVLEPVHGPTANVTHKIMVLGGDNPGLVARLSEVFHECQANIVRFNSEKIPGNSGNQYLIEFFVCIPESIMETCLAIIENTANSLQMKCDIAPYNA